VYPQGVVCQEELRQQVQPVRLRPLLLPSRPLPSHQLLRARPEAKVTNPMGLQKTVLFQTVLSLPLLVLRVRLGAWTTNLMQPWQTVLWLPVLPVRPEAWTRNPMRLGQTVLSVTSLGQTGRRGCRLGRRGSWGLSRPGSAP
jgi:hypothetical protein